MVTVQGKKQNYILRRVFLCVWSNMKLVVNHEVFIYNEIILKDILIN